MPSQSKANIETSEEDLSKYDWDGNALNRYPWLKHLAKRAYKHDSRFRTHVEYGYHMTGFRTITQSIDHSNNLYDRNVTRATWDNPACMGYWSYGSGAPSTVTIPADESKDYTSSMHDCEQIDRSLFDFILSTVTDESERDDLEREGGSDARTLILAIHAHKPPEEVSVWAVTQRQLVISAGIADASTKSFNHFRTWYNIYNEQTASPDPEAVAVAVFTTAVRKLGDNISGKLDYELLRTGAGVDALKTIRAIKTVLTRVGATTSTGTALQMGSGHDPRRAPAPAPAPATAPREYIKGKDDPCALCKDAPLPRHRRYWPRPPPPQKLPQLQALRAQG